MVDRTNGRRFVGALRAAGVSVVTLADVWGEPQAQDIPDPTWISYAAERGYTALTADDDLRYAPSNKQALTNSGLRVLCFPNGNLPWRTQVGRVLAHLLEIDRLITEVPGPWMAKLYGDGVKIVWPPELRTLP